MQRTRLVSDKEWINNRKKKWNKWKKIKSEKLAIYKIKKEVFWLAKIESIAEDAHNFWALHSRVMYINYWKVNVVQRYYKYHIVDRVDPPEKINENRAIIFLTVQFSECNQFCKNIIPFQVINIAHTLINCASWNIILVMVHNWFWRTNIGWYSFWETSLH